MTTAEQMIQTAKGPYLAQADKPSIDPVALQAALLGLHKRYPTDSCSAWWDIHPDGTHKIHFRLYHQDDYDFPSAWGHGATIEEALSKLVTDAGDRDPAKIRQNKIAELRDQIAKLEGAL